MNLDFVGNKAVINQINVSEKHKQDYVCLKDLSKSFQEGECNRVVLTNACAAFSIGELIAILGKSGSGKTILLNLISGIENPDRSEIWVAGKNLTNLDENQRTVFQGNHIGFVFQFFNLLPTLTFLENIMLPLSLVGLSGEHAAQRIQTLLQAVGLQDLLNAYPDRLSGGEQQRVANARALIHNPLLVLADEPTGNLDEDTGNQVLSLIDLLTHQSGRNLILVIHSPEAASIADRSILLRDGNLKKN